MPDTLGFRIRFYQSAASDLLRFLHGHYGQPITFRSRDAARMVRLRSGPSLFLTAHFHHWEHMGAWMTRQGIPLLSAARPMANPVSQSLLVRLRNRMSMKVVFHDIPRRALRHVNQGGCFGLLWDQRVSITGLGSGLTASPASSESTASRFQSPGSPFSASPTSDPEMSGSESFKQGMGWLGEPGLQPKLTALSPNVRANFFGRYLTLNPLPHFLTRHAPLPVFFGVLLPGGRFRVFQLAGPRGNLASSGPPSHRTGPTTPYHNLGRRYHRMLECLVRAYPTYWYGLAHGRFQGSDESE